VKTLPSLLILAGAALSQSPSALVGWGRENTGVDGPSRAMGDAGAALRSDKAWDPSLTARSAFNTLTALEAQVVPSLTWIDDGQTSNTIGNVEVPRLSVGIPLGSFGHLGGGYWQRFSRTFEYSVAEDTGYSLKGEGGAFEAVGSYAYALPFEQVRGLAFGASYHKVMGRDRVVQQINWTAPDEYFGVVRKDTLESRREGSYWTLSGYWTRGAFDVGAWTTLPGEIEITRHRGANDQVVDRDSVRTVDAPAGFGAAGAWRLLPRQAIVARVAADDWSESVNGADMLWSFGAGWQWKGGGDRYDDFWKRSAFRFGGLGAVGGVGDGSTMALTCGAGLPMGDYGTLDLSAQAGRTSTTSSGEELRDSFLRVYVSLTGANRWGQSQRKRR